ncbi:MAG: gamma-glutamyl-gamma-aminobutyrate hydrolase family protein [Lachnospiraceae bacterium]|nr:gamma-glutamyl-gamma-aminobutyrate hydrolase family protein [Lachnospiraceae bacterium]
MSKIILVTGMIGSNPRGGQMLSVNTAYMQAITAAGGVPVMMGMTKLAEEYAKIADGLLITGGESVHPARFGMTFDELADGDPTIAHNLKAGCNTTRDEMEFAAFEAFYKAGKPIMGICRGHQLVNAALGGKNMLNFPRKHRFEHSEGIQHEILTEPGSILDKLYGPKVLVNSFHRDCAQSAGEHVIVGARSTDGIIEEIEHETLPIFSVQFHPERMRGEAPNPTFGPDGTKLFEYFISLC